MFRRDFSFHDATPVLVLRTFQLVIKIGEIHNSGEGGVVSSKKRQWYNTRYLSVAGTSTQHKDVRGQAQHSAREPKLASNNGLRCTYRCSEIK